jgi:hypothetical protein
VTTFSPNDPFGKDTMTTTPHLWKASTQANTTTAGDQVDGQIAALNDGGYVVVWDDKSLAFNPGGDAIVGQRYDAAGNKVSGKIKLSGSITGADSEPAITTGETDVQPVVSVAHAFTTSCIDCNLS